jgi:hypothetical protein
MRAPRELETQQVTAPGIHDLRIEKASWSRNERRSIGRNAVLVEQTIKQLSSHTGRWWWDGLLGQTCDRRDTVRCTEELRWQCGLDFRVCRRNSARWIKNEE